VLSPCRDGALANAIREPGRARHAAPLTCNNLAGLATARLDALQAARTLNVKLPYLQGWIRSAGASWPPSYRRELEGPGFAAAPEAGPEGHSWNQFVGCRIPPACPHSLPQLRGRCTPSPASGRVFWATEELCRDWIKQETGQRRRADGSSFPIPIHRQPAYAGLG